MDITFRRPLLVPIDPFGTPDRGFDTARVTSPFGMRDGVLHTGLDIGMGRLGDAVCAAAPGKVFAVGALRYPWSQPTSRWPSGNYGGTMVVLRHSPHVFSTYCHLRPTTGMRFGEAVAAGDIIGQIGDTGSATGHGHLHHEILYVPVPLDVNRLMPREFYRDPWPLITGRAIISDGEEDTLPPRFPGSVYHYYGFEAPLPLFRTLAGARFRSEPSTVDGKILHEFEAGISFRPFGWIEGQIVNGNPTWLEARIHTGAGIEYGFLHRSTVTAVRLPISEAETKIAKVREIVAP